jgi:hypothetical protein
MLKQILSISSSVAQAFQRASALSLLLTGLGSIALPAAQAAILSTSTPDNSLIALVESLASPLPKAAVVASAAVPESSGWGLCLRRNRHPGSDGGDLYGLPTEK